MTGALVVIGAFLVGALPFTFWIGRFATGRDLREVGSRNPGATNLLRVAGVGPAGLGLLLDIGKGAGPVLAAQMLDAGSLLPALAALAATLGHIATPFLGLRGGKGVATAAGALAVLSPAPTLVGVMAFLVIVVWKRYVSLASVVAAATIGVLTLAAYVTGIEGGEETFASILIGLLVIGRHIANVRRLASGREPRLGEKVVNS